MYHFLLGGWVSLIVFVLLAIVPIKIPVALVLSVLVAFAAGAIKEVLDWVINYVLKKAGKAPRHSVESLDIAATGLGGLAIHVVLGLCVLIVKFSQ